MRNGEIIAFYFGLGLIVPARRNQATQLNKISVKINDKNTVFEFIVGEIDRPPLNTLGQINTN